MSDLDDLLNSLTDEPTKKNETGKQEDELDDVLNALNDMVEKKQTTGNPQNKEDNLDDLLDSLSDKPKQPQQTSQQNPLTDDLDDLLNDLNSNTTTSTYEEPTSIKKKTKTYGLDDKPTQTTTQKQPKDDLDDLLDGLDDKPTQLHAPKDDLDDLLDGLDDKPKPQPKRDEFDDLLDNLDTSAPKKTAAAPMQAVYNDDPNICAECGQPIGAQRITALGKSYHPEHFVCRSCKTPLGTNPFHNIVSLTDLQKYVIVVKPITGNMVNALDKTYHKECFTCNQCNKPFPTASFFQKDGNPYCESCYKDICAVKCAGCNKPIIGSSLSALQKKFHPECFVCSVCKAPFPRGQFYNLDGKTKVQHHLYVEDVVNPLHQELIFISAIGQRFHPEHFVCSFCVTPLTENSFKENAGKPYCFNCFGKLFG
ncbi:Paxillin [Entamoeba marina]